MNLVKTLASAMMTDFYQLSMAYTYWQNGRHEEPAVFDLFFRRCPFKGEFAIAGGIIEALEYIRDFRFTKDDTNYLRQELLPQAEPEFFEWLLHIDSSRVQAMAVAEGTVIFPRVPLMRIKGPLAIVQLLETTLLNIINYSTLMTTNARRFRQAVGPNIGLMEFGLRRAQGDAGLRASRYSYLGGFDATSNVLAGQIYGIPVQGTHAHSYVQSFTGLGELRNRGIVCADGTQIDDFVEKVLGALERVRTILEISNTNQGELAAFISYAQANPKKFLALADTYNTLLSGVPNFLAVAIALVECGYEPRGIRIDSGDLGYNSQQAKAAFAKVAEIMEMPVLAKCIVVASNDIDLEVIEELKKYGHAIDIFGIGTNLVTCPEQPALGGVFKLVQINETWRIKLSEDPGKTTLPGPKNAYRLYGQDGFALVDLLTSSDEPAPRAGDRITCCHPVDRHKQVTVIPARVEPLLVLAWNGQNIMLPESISEHRERVTETLGSIRADELRQLNPTPHKVSVSIIYAERAHTLWDKEMPEVVLS